jgi:macrolide-specific efflux system membrane fusion protein
MVTGKQITQQWKKRQVKWVVAALLVLVVWFVFGGKSEDASGVAYEFVAVTKGTVEEVVTAQGKLEPKEYVDVGAQVSGQLKEIHVEIGDVVKKGDLIAEIDPRVYQSRVQGSEARLKILTAQLAQQEAQMQFAKRKFARDERLVKTKAVSEEIMEESSTALKVAVAGVESLKAQIEEVTSSLDGDKTNLSYTRIFAPMDGTVVLQPAREGQTVNASQTAPVIIQLAQLDIMTVRAQVAEADVMQLTPGMEVSFTTMGNLEKRWKAKVRQILPAPEVINDVVLYNALVDVENKDRLLMSGMSTQMFFEMGKAENVLTMPVAALGKRMPDKDNDAGKAYMVKVKGIGGVSETLVHIGLLNRTLAEVKAGLSEGDEVAVPKPQKKSGSSGGGPGMRTPRL